MKQLELGEFCRDAGNDEPFWSQAEALPRAALEALQERRFLAQVDYCWNASCWYRDHWGAHGIRPDRIRGLQDLGLLPFLTKQHMRESQEQRPPYGLLLADRIDPARINRIGMTSGTTGKPVLLPFTAADYELWMEGVARALWAAGVRRADIVHPAFGFTPFVGLAGAYDACERWIGCLVVPGGTWDTNTRISMIPSLGITVLMGTPTYLLRLGREARKLGHDLTDWPVRVVFVTGEPGPVSVPSTGERLRELWHADVHEFSGSQETNYWSWTCSESVAHWNDDLVYHEVLDPQTKEPVADGQPGDLVVTDLRQRTHPLLRFPTGDRVRGFTAEPCACGRTLSRFHGFLGRVDDVVKIRGVSVAPAGIENVVRRHELTSDSYEIRFYTDGNGMDQVRVRVEPANELSEPEAHRLVDELAGQMRSSLLLSIGIDVVPRNTLPVFELKAKRIVDERQLIHEINIQ